MAQPNKQYEFALDAQFDTSVGTSGSAWHGENNKVIPTQQVLSQGFTPSITVSAQYMNYLMNSHGDWIGFLSQSHAALSGAVEPIEPFVTHQIASGAIVLDEAIERTVIFDATEGIAEGGWQIGAGDSVELQGNDNFFHLPLNSRLPQGAWVMTASVLLTPGQGEATVGNRLTARMTHKTMDFTSGSESYGSGLDLLELTVDSTSNTQVVELTGPFYVSKTGSLYVEVLASINSSVSPDAVHGVQVTFLDPGARNF